MDKWLNREDEETQCYPPFEPFCDSLEQEARIACNTVYSKQNSTETKEEKRVVRGFRQKMTSRSFSTDVREEEHLSGCNEVTVLATAHVPVQSKDRSCALFGRSHILESCGQFHKMKQLSSSDGLFMETLFEVCWGAFQKRRRLREEVERNTNDSAYIYT